jgi:hypothetical protein
VVFAFFFEGRVVSPLYGVAFSLTLGGLALYHRAPAPTFAPTFGAAKVAKAPLFGPSDGGGGAVDCAATRPARAGEDEGAADREPSLQQHQHHQHQHQSPLYSQGRGPV